MPSKTPRAPSYRLNPWDYAFLAGIALDLTAVLYAVTAEYRAGAANHADNLLGRFFITVLASCFAWIALLVLGLAALIQTRPTVLKWLAYLLVWFLPLATGFGGFWHGGGGAAQYRSGIEQWVAHVDPAPIQRWLATQKTSDETVLVPESAWPPAIRELHPQRVDLWRERGVALSWGRVGHDGDRRQIFIARSPDTPPPTQVLWNLDGTHDTWEPIVDHWPADWIQSKPGVWWWLIYGS